jgi:glycosyltransferase involved in cell wall biosynthesis
LKVGILNTTTVKKSVGTFNYTLTLIEALKKERKNEYIVFYTDPDFKNYVTDVESIFLPTTILTRVVHNIAELLCLKFVTGRFKVLRNCDLLIAPTVSLLPSITGVPYVVVVHDLMHKYLLTSPDYSIKDRITRDIVYKYAVRRSLVTVAISEQNKKDLVRFYQIDEDKIRIIPPYPSWFVYKYKEMEKPYAKALLNKYRLPEKFIFYPSQILHQKNQSSLIRAVYLLLKKYNVKIPVIFAGPVISKEYFKYLIKLTKDLRIEDQIYFLKYVSEETLVALYKCSHSLVLPTFAGPTELPLLEAMVLGTPILCSNIFEFPKQVGDAGLLFDPNSIEDLAEKIYAVWVNENLRQELIEKGYERAKTLTLENFGKEWEELIKNVHKKLQ